VTAEHVVLATMATPMACGLDCDVRSCPCSGDERDQPAAEPHCAGCHAEPWGALRSGTVTVYYRVDQSQRLLIGGRGPMREIDSPSAIHHLMAYARRLWPALREVSWSHAWGDVWP